MYKQNTIGRIQNGLIMRYAEPWRFYHTERHVRSMLKKWRVIQRSHPDEQIVQNPIPFEWAIWYHDAIYYPSAKDNEFRSADLARAELPDLIGDKDALMTGDLVICTWDHQSHFGNPDTEFFLDLDLSILGEERVVYMEYADNIRKEYAKIPDADYARGRISILESFLSRPRIFYTDYFLGRELVARSNITTEIERLKENV